MKKMKTSIYLFPAALAVVFMSSILIIISPIGHQTLIPIPTPTPILSTTPTLTPNVRNQDVSKQIGYIKNAYTKNNKNFIDIDYIQWINDNSAPNGYRIVNDNSLIRTLEVIDSSKVNYLDWTTSGDLVGRNIDFNEFINISNLNSRVFWITLNSQNQVTDIKEQYRP